MDNLRPGVFGEVIGVLGKLAGVGVIGLQLDRAAAKSYDLAKLEVGGVRSVLLRCGKGCQENGQEEFQGETQPSPQPVLRALTPQPP